MPELRSELELRGYLDQTRKVLLFQRQHAVWPGARRARVAQILDGQKISFMPSWSCRELPRSPRVERVAVICPYVVAVILFCGCVKFGWFSRLNASARNCSEKRSR